MRHHYSFILDSECPNCKVSLTKPGRVKVEGVDGEFYVKGGVVAEDEFTDLILADSEPTITCGSCGEELDVESQEEMN